MDTIAQQRETIAQQLELIELQHGALEEAKGTLSVLAPLYPASLRIVDNALIAYLEIYRPDLIPVATEAGEQRQ